MNYIILELIPTSSNPLVGDIIQISALKIHDLKLVDRFDVRLVEEAITIPDLIELISYDKEAFKYIKTSSEITNLFKEWSLNYKLILIDNNYTKSYLKDFDDTVFIHELLNMESSNTIIDEMINKYSLIPSNHIVDLMYEALIYESNNKKI